MAGDVSIGPFVVGETVVTSVISFLLPSYHRSRLTIVRCVLLVCVELFVKVIIAGEVIAFQLLSLAHSDSELIVAYRHRHTTSILMVGTWKLNVLSSVMLNRHLSLHLKKIAI